MRRSEGPELPADLVAVQTQFEHWRATRSKLCRIPEGLWSAAVEVAGEHGVQRVARTLRLDYMDLKRRVQACTAELPEVSVRGVRFVEVPLSPSPEEASVAASGVAMDPASSEHLLEPAGALSEPWGVTGSRGETVLAGPLSFLPIAEKSGLFPGPVAPAAQPAVKPCMVPPVEPFSAPRSGIPRESGEGARPGAEVELLSPDGTTLVVRLPVGERLDVVALCSALWRRGACSS